MNFSVEIGPHTDLETLPPVKDVYITLLPGEDYTKTAEKAGNLMKILRMTPEDFHQISEL